MRKGGKGERNRKSDLFSLSCPILSFPATSCAYIASNLLGTGTSRKGKLHLILSSNKFFVLRKKKTKTLSNEQLFLLWQLGKIEACLEGVVLMSPYSVD